MASHGKQISGVLAISLLIILVWISQARGDEEAGGWMPASVEDSMKYYSNVCNIPKIPISEMTKERFDSGYHNKPFVITFPNGKDDWVQSEYWSIANLTDAYDDWTLSAGKTIDIVYSGGKGDVNTTFKNFVDEMRTKAVPGGDFTYLFDRSFYYNSSLPDTINLPNFLSNEGDSILFIGPSGTGATWHKHMPAWNGVIFGQKRWFIYPVKRTPPGGLYTYTPMDWLEYVYPKLKPADKPLECIQNAGEIFYVPESYYHAILNIGETVAISVQSKDVVTQSEAEFYRAMEDHYKATTLEDEALITAHYEAADRRFVDLHFLYPDNTEVLTHIAEIACERGHTLRCERVLNYIINIDPFSINSLKLRSRIYYDRSEFGLSENDVAVGLKIHPSSKALLRERANYLWSVKKAASKKAYEKLLEVLDPDTTEAKGIRDLLKMTDFGPLPEEENADEADTSSDPAISDDQYMEDGASHPHIDDEL